MISYYMIFSQNISQVKLIFDLFFQVSVCNQETIVAKFNGAVTWLCHALS